MTNTCIAHFVIVDIIDHYSIMEAFEYIYELSVESAGKGGSCNWDAWLAHTRLVHAGSVDTWLININTWLVNVSTLGWSTSQHSSLVSPHSVGPHSVGSHLVGPHSVGPHLISSHVVGHSAAATQSSLAPLSSAPAHPNWDEWSRARPWLTA